MARDETGERAGEPAEGAKEHTSGATWWSGTGADARAAPMSVVAASGGTEGPAADVEAPVTQPADDRSRPDGDDTPRRERGWLEVAAFVVVGIGLAALVAATIALRMDLGDHRADAAEAATAEARLATARDDAALLAVAVSAHLERAQQDGAEAVAARAAQVARLTELGLTEADMEAALDEAQASTAAVEAERDALAADVDRQRLEDVELQTCLAEVRSAVDAAFHAKNRDGVDVPPTREICRSLASARSGS